MAIGPSTVLAYERGVGVQLPHLFGCREDPRLDLVEDQVRQEPWTETLGQRLLHVLHPPVRVTRRSRRHARRVTRQAVVVQQCGHEVE